MGTKRNKKNLLLMIMGIVACIGIILSIAWIKPSTTIDYCLKYGRYKEIVFIVNHKKINENDSKEIKLSIEKYMDRVWTDWNGENVSYEKARKVFAILSDTKDKEISKKAKKYRKLIRIENEGNEIIEKVEKAYADGNYIKAMKETKQINQSYSQYEVVLDLYSECKEILLYKVANPESVSDYEQSIKLLNSYIKETKDRDFVDAKNSLKKELKEYRDIYSILTDATKLFEEKSYKKSFSILNKGRKKYPNNKKIKYALSIYQYSYVIDITSKVVKLADKDDYDSVINVLEDAIEIYDCQSFRDLLHEAKMKTSLLYAAKSKLKEAGNYVLISAKKMVLGDYAEDEQETLLSLGGSVAASVTNVDAPLDVRDLAYDMTHWGEGDYFGARLALDAVGVLPIVGALKYIKRVDTLSDTAKTAGKIADHVDTAHDLGKKADAIADSGKTLDNISNADAVVLDVKKKAKKVADLTDDYSDFIKKAEKGVDVEKDAINYTQYKTINQFYEGKLFPGTNIVFERKKLDLSDGRHIIGVFPKFESYVDIQLPDECIKASFNKQKIYLSKQLKKMTETRDGRKKLKKIFNKEQIKEIRQGIIPSGFVWHHNETEGLMQLVDEKVHAKVRHTGGMSIWGVGHK